MSEVQLSFYGQLPATLLLGNSTILSSSFSSSFPSPGWGSQSGKRVIGNFEVINTTNSIEYYYAGNYSSNSPVDVDQATRTW